MLIKHKELYALTAEIPGQALRAKTNGLLIEAMITSYLVED